MTRTFALIPVKELEHAKARLAPVLDEPARRELVLAMLRDVLDAAMACRGLDGAAVVSRDEDVLSIAREAGAKGLAEPGDPSTGSGQVLNEALMSAAEKLRARGATRVLVLAADLPLADARSIAAVLQSTTDIALVSSRDGGTNALAIAPGAIEFQFGPNSARRHLSAARAAGLSAASVDLPRLAFDIDTPEDLKRLRNAPDAGRHTREALERSGPSTGSGQGLLAPRTKR